MTGKFTWLIYDSGKNVMHCNYAKIITGSMFLCSVLFICFHKILRSRLIVVIITKNLRNILQPPLKIENPPPNL